MAGTTINLNQVGTISLDTFKKSVQSNHESPHGFIRLSRTKEGQLTRFGETFWETKKNHARDNENAMVRLAFYKSLRDAGVKGETMQNIMNSLGITVDNETQMATVAGNAGLSRYEIKQLLTTADNYLNTRIGFLSQLEKEGCNDMQDFLGRQLDLDANGDNDHLPIDNAQKLEIRDKIKDFNIKRFTTEERNKGIAKSDYFFNNVPEDVQKIIETKNKEMKNLAELRQWLPEIVQTCNGKILDAKKDVLQELVDSKLEDLKNKSNCDYTAAKEIVFKTVKEAAQKHSTVFENDKELRDAITQELDNLDAFINDNKSTLEGILQANPPFNELQQKTLLTKLFAKDKLMCPDFIELCSKYRDAFKPMFELMAKKKPTLADFADAFNKVLSSTDSVVKAMASTMQTAADENANISDVLFALCKNDYQTVNGKVPDLSKNVRQLMETFNSNLDLICDTNPDSNPLKDEEGCAGTITAKQIALAEIAQKFGVSELKDVKNLTSPAQPVLDFLANCLYDRPLSFVYKDDFKQTFVEALTNGLEIPDNAKLKTMDPEKKYLTQTLKDLSRGSMWKLGDITLSNVTATRQEQIETIMDFFKKDTQNGLKAAYILGNVLNQSVVNFLTQAGDETKKLFSRNLDFDTLYAFTPELQNDGSYIINVQSTSTLKKTNDNPPIIFDMKNSYLNIGFKLRLSFQENNQYSIAVEGNILMDGELNKSSFDAGEFSSFKQINDENSNSLGKYVLYDPAMENNQELKTLHQNYADNPDYANEKALKDFLKKNAITYNDIAKLNKKYNINLTLLNGLFERRLKTTEYPTKQLVNDLLGNDETKRLAAVPTFKNLLKPYLELYGLKKNDINLA